MTRTTLGFSGIENLNENRAFQMAEERGYTYRLRDTWVVQDKPEPIAVGNKHGHVFHQRRGVSEYGFEQSIYFGSGLVSLEANLGGEIFSAIVWAETRGDALALMERVRALYPVQVLTTGDDEPVIFCQFWFMGTQGPQVFTRKLEAPKWDEITANYPTAVRDAIAPLMAGRPATDRGKVLLWRGVPGTGKTYAIRALARAWASVVTIKYVIDPESFLSNPSYLMQVISANNHQQQSGPSLVVLEDAGELVARDAKSRTGQGLSRLLNVAEGFLGQGLDLNILITTNEEVASLNDAISRPGRCVSNVEFTAFTREEGAEWLKGHGALPAGGLFQRGSATLAEMYAHAQPEGPLVPGRKPEPVVGFGAFVRPGRTVSVCGRDDDDIALD